MEYTHFQNFLKKLGAMCKSDMSNELFTIGYSPHDLNSFLCILKKYKITAIADVRSAPYSQFKPEFNRDHLSEFLYKNGVVYVFLGDVCGARIESPDCYLNGKIDYSLVAQNKKFNECLRRIINGMEKFRIALMCAEKDPITCHRTILICRNLDIYFIKIRHLLHDGTVEEHQNSEQRLLELFNLNHPDLFRSAQERLNDAYLRQGKKIAFEAAEPLSD